ncbi:SUMF1/EgtB/PvdO family nonheme iron enzyme [Klebsiella michiganensis]
MVPVQGGEFLMGDFGPLVKEKLPFSIQQDDKKLHKVVLSDFAISKFKVTNADYTAYLKSTGEKNHQSTSWLKIIHPWQKIITLLA